MRCAASAFLGLVLVCAACEDSGEVLDEDGFCEMFLPAWCECMVDVCGIYSGCPEEWCCDSGPCASGVTRAEVQRCIHDMQADDCAVMCETGGALVPASCFDLVAPRR